jgi:hypothetical protein
MHTHLGKNNKPAATCGGIKIQNIRMHTESSEGLYIAVTITTSGDQGSGPQGHQLSPSKPWSSYQM